MIHHPNTKSLTGSQSALWISTLGGVSNSCSWSSTYQKKYHDGDSINPKVNDVIYNEAGLTTTYNGNGGYFKLQGTHYSIKIASNGNVDEVVDCNNESGYTAFFMSGTDEASSSAACNLIWEFETYFHNGSGDFPAVDDLIYYRDSSDNIVALTGYNDKWFVGDSNGGLGASAYELDGTGKVTSIVYCHDYLV